MRKKFFIIVGIIILFLLSLFTLIWFNDNYRFKFSYEYINNMEYSNGKKIKVHLPKKYSIKYLKKNEILDFISSDTGVIYFGYNSCPWCRRNIPVLLNAVTDNGLNLFYVDIKSKNFDSVKNDFYKLMDEYLELNDDGEKVLKVPAVYFIKKGVIVDKHVGTIDSYKNAFKDMSDEQVTELYNLYNNMIKEMNDYE